MFGFKDIGLGTEGGSGSQDIGSSLPDLMPNGFPVIGCITGVAGFGWTGIGGIGKVN